MGKVIKYKNCIFRFIKYESTDFTTVKNKCTFRVSSPISTLNEDTDIVSSNFNNVKIYEIPSDVTKIKVSGAISNAEVVEIALTDTKGNVLFSANGTKDCAHVYELDLSQYIGASKLYVCEQYSGITAILSTRTDDSPLKTVQPKKEPFSITPKIVEEVKNLSVFTKVDAYVLGKIKEMIGDRRMQPKDWACLMAVLDDYGQLYERSRITAFVRAMMALGIIPELDEDGVTSLRKKISRNLHNYDEGFRSWKPNMKSIKDYCYNLAEVLEKSDGFKYRY